MPPDELEMGVGRGNGSGSRRTRFGQGQPTNRGGRRTKERKPASGSISQALHRVLAESVSVSVGGRPTNMSRYDLIVRVVLEDLESATIKERIMLINSLSRIPPPEYEPEDAIPPNQDAIHALVASLGIYHEMQVAKEAELRRRGVVIPSDRPAGQNMAAGLWEAHNGGSGDFIVKY